MRIILKFGQWYLEDCGHALLTVCDLTLNNKLVYHVTCLDPDCPNASKRFKLPTVELEPIDAKD
jgi:hypothetical protein